MTIDCQCHYITFMEVVYFAHFIYIGFTHIRNTIIDFINSYLVKKLILITK